MTTYSVQRAKSQTLGAGVEDIVNLADFGRYIQIVNRGATNPLSFVAGSAPAAVTALADESFTVMPNTALTVPYPRDCTDACQVRLISTSGTTYSVQVIADRQW